MENIQVLEIGEDEGIPEGIRRILEDMAQDTGYAEHEETPERKERSLFFKYVSSALSMGEAIDMLGKGITEDPGGQSMSEILASAEVAHLEAIDELTEYFGKHWYEEKFDRIQEYAQRFANFAEAVQRIPLALLYHLIPSGYGIDHILDGDGEED